VFAAEKTEIENNPMKTATITQWLGILCGCLYCVSAGAQTTIENFEYASDADMLATWSPQRATLSLSSSVAASSVGTNSLRVERTFPASAWETEILTGPVLPAALTVASTQYLTLRISGDSQFTNASYQTLFLYAYDGAGNFGRWGAPVPTTNNWQIFNFMASSIQAPWDSPGLPDFNNIVQFKFFLYGQGDPAGAEFSATIYIDDLTVRNSPLIETPPITPQPAMIENFEYANDDDLLAAWSPEKATLSLSPSVAPGSTGTNSLRVERYFPANAWETEVLTKLVLPAPMAIASTQYLTLRISGDSQFTNASWQTLYLYAYDAVGNFGRWGAPVPTDTNWQVFNFTASTIQAPWNSPGLPDFNNIVQFKFFLYGQGDPAGTEFSAIIYIDDVMVRNTPLIEFPAPAAMRALVDDFEGYADDAALRSFYSYQNSPAATVTTAAIETPAPQGSKALKLGIDFAAGQWPWGSVRSATMAPFSLSTNALVSFRIKGDPTLAPLADDGTSFWLSFYDTAGRGLNFSTPAAPVISSEWTAVTASFDQFWSDTIVDIGNLVQWRILVEGWTGTADSTAQSATFYVDDIRISVPPVLSIVSEGAALKLRMDSLIPGTTYTLRMTPDFSQWTTTTILATSTSATWSIPTGQQKGFFQLYYTP
jgi:hypothetical protein